VSMLGIKNLSYSYKNKTALSALNLIFNEPALVGIFGHNGCGKSTLFKILSGLFRVDSGELYFLGQPATDARGCIKTSLRPHIGALFQEPSSDAMLTLRDNMRYFSMMMGLDKKNEAFHVSETLELANLSLLADRRVKTLSSGMRRRLELYRTFMHKPQLVFLDEPSAGLDTSESGKFLSFVKDYQKRERALVLMATHHPHELEHCDEVVMMSAGAVIEHERPGILRNELDHWRYEVELDPQGDIRALAFMRADLGDAYAAILEREHHA